MSQFENNNFDSFRIKMHTDIGRERALDEALKLLNRSELTSDDAVDYENRINKKKLIKKIKHATSTRYDDREQLDTIIELLERANFSSEDAVTLRKKRDFVSAIILIFLGMATILAAIFIIVLDPEMIKGPTIIYFNPYDGVTVSDIIALLMIGFSTFFFVWSYALLQPR
jgi:hypothetical protein